MKKEKKTKTCLQSSWVAWFTVATSPGAVLNKSQAFLFYPIQLGTEKRILMGSWLWDRNKTSMELTLASIHTLGATGPSKG